MQDRMALGERSAGQFVPFRTEVRKTPLTGGREERFVLTIVISRFSLDNKYIEILIGKFIAPFAIIPARR